jgi:hypothetical protein
MHISFITCTEKITKMNYKHYITRCVAIFSILIHRINNTYIHTYTCSIRQLRIPSSKYYPPADSAPIGPIYIEWINKRIQDKNELYTVHRSRPIFSWSQPKWRYTGYDVYTSVILHEIRIDGSSLQLTMHSTLVYIWWHNNGTIGSLLIASMQEDHQQYIGQALFRNKHILHGLRG